MKKIIFAIFVLVCVAMVFSFTAETTLSQTQYRLERVQVVEKIPCTGYKKVFETQYVEETITTYETIWETERREQRYSVARKVPETSYSERRYTVHKPVEEITYKDTSYDVLRTVPQTSEREDKYLVTRQVMESKERQVYETRRVPVQETTVEDRVYTVNRPITNYVETVVDKGQYISQVNTLPGQSYERLAWQRANYVDPVTGESKWRLPGFYWTTMQGPTRYETNKVYQPNYVAETVPVVKTVQEQRIDQVPVTRTTYRDEQIVRTEQIQVPRLVQEEVVRKIPVTTYKQIVERVEQKTPVTVRRMVSEDVVERIPNTTYKTVMEEQVRPYEVKVAKVVPVTRTVQKPVMTERWEPYTYTMERQKTEVRRVPIKSVSTPQSTPLAKPEVDPASLDPADIVPRLPLP
jgi:hypothetical protein